MLLGDIINQQKILIKLNLKLQCKTYLNSIVIVYYSFIIRLLFV